MIIILLGFLLLALEFFAWLTKYNNISPPYLYSRRAIIIHSSGVRNVSLCMPIKRVVQPSNSTTTLLALTTHIIVTMLAHGNILGANRESIVAITSVDAVNVYVAVAIAWFALLTLDGSSSFAHMWHSFPSHTPSRYSKCATSGWFLWEEWGEWWSSLGEVVAFSNELSLRCSEDGFLCPLYSNLVEGILTLLLEGLEQKENGSAHESESEVHKMIY